MMQPAQPKRRGSIALALIGLLAIAGTSVTARCVEQVEAVNG